MALSDMAVRNAKPKDKPYKLGDGRGLYLLVGINGSRLWRFDYMFQGKRKLISLGAYPDVSLAKARERLAKVREQVADGRDPSAEECPTRHESQRRCWRHVDVDRLGQRL